MSRQYLNDRWCVRCNKTDPTPYLKKNLKLLPKRGRVLDIGCGNCRNTNFMLEGSNAYSVTPVDMVGDYGQKLVLGKDSLKPTVTGCKYDIILANYVLMFLNKRELYKVFKDIHNICSKVGTCLMIEMYDAKDSYHYDFDHMIVGYFKRRRWSAIRHSKDKCILVKEK